MCATWDVPGAEPVRPPVVAGPHGGVSGRVLAGDVAPLGVGVEDEQGLEVAPDALGRHVLPLGADLQHTHTHTLWGS